MEIPNVLLLGNGLNRSFGGISWAELMKEINISIYNAEKLTCPMPLQAILVTNNQIAQAIKTHNKSFFGKVDSSELRAMLIKLLTAGFSDILTTNYSYELEIASTAVTEATYNYIIKTNKSIIPEKRIDSRYLLHSYQSISCNDVNNRIWHIHGEARKPSSMILGHYDYANHLQRIAEHIKLRQHDYRKTRSSFVTKSWVDSFVLGNVYIIGFELDYSEMDIWWLLNRKKREKAPHGQVYFYTAEKDLEKHGLLELLDVQVRHSGKEKPKTEKEKAQYYKDFYVNAIDEIIKTVK